MRAFNLVTAALLLMLAVIYGCSSQEHPNNPIEPEIGAFTCVQCHTTAGELQKFATPVRPPGGEAGEG